MCNKKPSTRLHGYQPFRNNQEVQNTPDLSSQYLSEDSVIAMYVEQDLSNIIYSNWHAMLATFIVNINDASGAPHRCRAILDTGSQLNFVTNAYAQKLKLNSCNSSTLVTRIISKSVYAKSLVPTIMSSQYGQYTSNIQFYSLPVISNQLPTLSINVNDIILPSTIQLQLADPQFYKSAPIDCLLGAEVVFELFKGNCIAFKKHLSAHHSKLSWVITGRLFNSNSSISTSSTSSNPLREQFALPCSQKQVYVQKKSTKQKIIFVRLYNELKMTDSLFDYP